MQRADEKKVGRTESKVENVDGETSRRYRLIGIRRGNEQGAASTEMKTEVVSIALTFVSRKTETLKKKLRKRYGN